MIKKLAFYLILFLFLMATASAQKMLAFDKRGKVKRVRYYIGSEIKVKLIDKTFLFGQITRIDDQSFQIGNELINTDSVQYVYSKDEAQAGLKLFSGILFTAGAVYLPLVSFNRTINGDRPIVREQAVRVSGGLIAGGLLLHLLTKKKYKISEKRPLKIIDVSL